MTFPRAVLCATTWIIAAASNAQSPGNTRAIDRTVISQLSSLFQIKSKVTAHLDLTQTFQTKSRWMLVTAKQPDETSSAVSGADERMGAISLCFVNDDKVDCSEEIFSAQYPAKRIASDARRAPHYYELHKSDIVFSGPQQSSPLLRIKTCSISGATGNCEVATFLFDYDRSADKFRVVFFNLTGRNNNEECRLIEDGVLRGRVIAVNPTPNAPFGYFVEVYKRGADGRYAQVLRYRSKTRYGDGNPLAVIDSEMPETLHRLGLWNPGDALPVPPRMPRGCTRLVMRNGVEWCVLR